MSVCVCVCVTLLVDDTCIDTSIPKYLAKHGTEWFLLHFLAAVDAQLRTRVSS